MSFAIHGIGISGGVAIGRAHLLAHGVDEVSHYAIASSDIDQEIARFDSAVATVRNELESLKQTSFSSAPEELNAFLNLHLMILNDETLSAAPRDLIHQQQCNAEWALKQQADTLLDQFEAIEDAYLRERRADVMQVVERVLKVLLGHPGPSHQDVSGNGRILVARDLSPADTILYKQHHIAAFITDLGGSTSHTAILARSLNIPSIVALHHAWSLIRENELLIVDGTQGIVLVNPDELIVNEYKLKQNQWDLERQKLKRLRATPAVTLDGTLIELQANIELPEDIDGVRECGATGVGLFRSEFLFLGRVDLPSEEADLMADDAKRCGLDIIRLVAPTTDDARLPLVLQGSSGFVYYVSITGITGTRTASSAELAEAIPRIRKFTDLPIAVGFGVRSPEQAAGAVRAADGAVVASALIDTLAGGLDAQGRAGPDTVRRVLDQIRALAEGVRGART